MEQNNHSIADAYTVPLTGKHLMEASAGTGKTYNIVTLFLRMVLAGIPLRKILVVTFTEAATAELVNRVRKGLVAMAHALEGTGQVPEQCAPFLDPSAALGSTCESGSGTFSGGGTPVWAGD